jgi:PAS domain-containing protein
MSIQDLGALGELVAAIATIATLLYLAVQIRQNNRNLQESTSASINQGFASINSRLSSDEQFAEIFIRGREDLEALNAVELERFRAFVQDILNMAVYADGLQASHDVRSLHFDAFEVVGSLYQSYPGIRAVIDSIEPATPRDLVQRFRDITPTYAFIIDKQRPARESV